MKASLRKSLATLVGSVALLVAPAAFAAGEPCFNDTDCAGGGAVCGGDVCNWNMAHPTPVGDMAYTCVTAGTDPKGMDGWCTGPTHDNCKCKAEGAKCVGVHCTFTKASDAPAGTAGTGSGGTGAGTAGAATTAGTGTAGTAAKPAPADEGGCSLSIPGGSNTGMALGVGLLGLGLALARRRR